MSIVDPLLPAAAHLTGSGAAEVLRPAMAAAGVELIACRASNVQYRPESDLVVRYRCRARHSGLESVDTILAATTIAGAPAGTVPVEARTADGTDLSVGVWRWPFDPVLTDLTRMVTPHLAAEQLRDLVGDHVELEVVAYRPTERAVVRLRGSGREFYVKVVPPATTAALVARHEALVGAGLPVPRVAKAGNGWLAMEAIHGTTLRDRLKHGVARLPEPGCYRDLLDALAAIELPGAVPARSRLADAAHHAAMLATVVPDARSRLGEITDRLATPDTDPRPVQTVHGDLHEAQLVVDDHSVVGVLDVDDAGPGDPLDDVATLVGHLSFRAVAGADDRIAQHARYVRDTLASGHDPSDVDRRIAAVLIGLATGPFRIQHPTWVATTTQVLELIERHLDAADLAAGVTTR